MTVEPIPANFTPAAGHPLLERAVDTHVHPGPSFILRRLSIVEAATQARDAGMAGMVVKDHHMPTAALALLANDQVEGISVLGSLTLNASVGGLNPEAVEASVQMGAAVVWLPTISARNHHAAVDKGTHFTSSGRGVDRPGRIVDLLNGGRPVRALSEVLEVLGEHTNVVLATGHARASELEVIVPAALGAGVERLVITHPAYIVGADEHQLRRWTRDGAYAEVAGSTSWSGSSLFSVPVEQTLRMIASVGADHLVMSSDFGQTSNPVPVAAMSSWILELLEAGVPERQLHQMLTRNPTELLGLSLDPPSCRAPSARRD